MVAIPSTHGLSQAHLAFQPVGDAGDDSVDPLEPLPEPPVREESRSVKRAARDICQAMASSARGAYSAISWGFGCLDPIFLANKVYRVGIQVLKETALLTFAPGDKLEVLRDRLHQFSLSEHRGNVCTVAAHWVKDWLLHNFRYSPYPSAHLPSHWATRVFRTSSGSPSFLGQRIEELVKDEEELLLHSVEVTLLRAFSGLSSNLVAHMRAKEGGTYFDKDFLLNTSSKLLETTTQHFRQINELFREYGKHLDPDVLKAEFGKDLHRAISCDVRMPLSEQKKQQMENFFKGFSEKVMHLAFPNGQSDLEAPFYIRKRLWNAFKDVMVPNMLMELYHHLFDPAALNQIILTLLEAADSPCLLPKDTIIAPKLPEKKQHRLNVLAGKFIREMGTFLSPSAARTLFRAPGVEKKLGGILGGFLGKLIYEPNVIDNMINATIHNTLPKTLPGRWQVVKNRFRFVPRQGGVFHFTFPKNPSERKELEEAEEEKKEWVKARLSKRIDRSLNSPIKNAVSGLFAKVWRPVHQTTDIWVEGLVGELGLEVKHAFEAIFSFFVGTLLGTMLAIAFYPITRPCGMVVDYYTRGKAAEILDKIHMEIHQNLIYKLSDDLMDALYTS